MLRRLVKLLVIAAVLATAGYSYWQDTLPYSPPDESRYAKQNAALEELLSRPVIVRPNVPAAPAAPKADSADSNLDPADRIVDDSDPIRTRLQKIADDNGLTLLPYEMDESQLNAAARRRPIMQVMENTARISVVHEMFFGNRIQLGTLREAIEAITGSNRIEVSEGRIKLFPVTDRVDRAVKQLTPISPLEIYASGEVAIHTRTEAGFLGEPFPTSDDYTSFPPILPGAVICNLNQQSQLFREIQAGLRELSLRPTSSEPMWANYPTATEDEAIWRRMEETKVPADFRAESVHQAIELLAAAAGVSFALPPDENAVFFNIWEDHDGNQLRGLSVATAIRVIEATFNVPRLEVVRGSLSSELLSQPRIRLYPVGDLMRTAHIDRGDMERQARFVYDGDLPGQEWRPRIGMVGDVLVVIGEQTDQFRTLDRVLAEMRRLASGDPASSSCCPTVADRAAIQRLMNVRCVGLPGGPVSYSTVIEYVRDQWKAPLFISSEVESGQPSNPRETWVVDKAPTFHEAVTRVGLYWQCIDGVMVIGARRTARVLFVENNGPLLDQDQPQSSALSSARRKKFRDGGSTVYDTLRLLSLSQ